MRDPKPTPRIRDPLLLELLKLEYDECELSGRTEGMHLHHVVFRTHGGDDVRANIVNLDDRFHSLYHGANREVMQALAIYVRDFRQDTVAYINRKVDGGFDLWFDRHMKGRL